MDRALPEYNRVLHKKWLSAQRRLHKDRLHQSRPQVDTSVPSACRYPLVKSKKEQILEERCTEIEKANRLLLEKMTNIMVNKGKLTRLTIKMRKNQQQCSSPLSSAAVAPPIACAPSTVRSASARLTASPRTTRLF